MGKRRRAREIAIQMLYQRELGGAPLDDIFGTFDLGDYVRETEAAVLVTEEETRPEDVALLKTAPSQAAVDPAPGTVNGSSLTEAELRQIQESFSYAQKLLAGVDENREEIDERIRRHAENWRLERMPVIDRNILRLAVYEMLYESSVPKVVIVDEAIELAKKFGSENSGRFVNGLLDGVLKAETEAEEPAAVVPSSIDPGGSA